MQTVTERLGQVLGTSSTYQTSKNIRISMCPEILNLWVIAERILCTHQQQFSVNVGAGMVGDCLIGPHVLPHRLTGHHDRYVLLHDLPELLEAVPLAVRGRMYEYMHDGAPTHCSQAERDVLSNSYHD
jgi:hypothetical protein